MAITYTPSVNFGAKDSLPTNDPDKVIKGSEFTTEFTAIQTAFSLAAPAASPTFTGTVTIPTADINGGAIDGTTIGGTTPAAATFTSVTATTADINGGNIDGTVIGAATPAAGSFTTGQFSTSLNVDGTVTADGLTVDTTAPFMLFKESGATKFFIGESSAVGGGAGYYDFYAVTGLGQRFFTNAAEAMRIDSAGNVGIGTSSPAVKLHVAGETRIYPASGTAVLRFGENTTEKGKLSVDNTSNMVFETAGTERMRINSSGNVGIGTSSPACGLDVSNAGNGSVGEQVRISSTDTDSKLAFVNTGGNGAIVQSSGAMRFMTNTANNERMRIDASGNVVIGATTAAQRLHVSSAGSVTRALIENTNNAAAGAGIQMLVKNGVTTVGNGTIRIDNADNMQFFNIGGERARIDSSGNLFVGTTVNYPGVSGLGGNIKGMMSEGGGSLFLSRVDSNPVLYINRGGTDGDSVRFAKDAGSTVGSISVTASATAYNTSSDARLKENIADAESASELIDAIQVRQFDWKADGSHQRYGMVAQELLEVAPEAVSQGATEEDMMGVDYSKLVPMLVKEIQSLRARVAQLEGA